jgi:predicted RNA-binding Zn ribbon-like protein
MAGADEAARPPFADGRLTFFGALLRHATQVRADAAHDEVLGVDRAVRGVDIRRIDGRAVVASVRLHSLELRNHLRRAPQNGMEAKRPAALLTAATTTPETLGVPLRTSARNCVWDTDSTRARPCVQLRLVERKEKIV